MKVTLLGSGDAIGMPAPMCNCEYCQKSERRRRSGLLVETEETTVVVDISPDIKEQLHHEEVYDVDAFIVTHFHFDHFWGIQELNHVVLPDGRHVFNPGDFDYNGWHDREIKIIGNETTLNHMDETHQHDAIEATGNIEFRVLKRTEKMGIGDLEAQSFGIEHGGENVTQGYVIEKDDTKIAYAPDAVKLEDSEVYRGCNLLFVEGQLFDADGHADQEVLEKQINDADADRVVLLSNSEHLNQMHTEELEKAAEEKGFEIWSDFESVKL